MTNEDARPIIRTLRDALWEARPYVELEAARLVELVPSSSAERAALVLEQLDDAVAEAEEVLS